MANLEIFYFPYFWWASGPDKTTPCLFFVFVFNIYICHVLMLFTGWDGQGKCLPEAAANFCLLGRIIRWIRHKVLKVRPWLISYDGSVGWPLRHNRPKSGPINSIQRIRPVSNPRNKLGLPWPMSNPAGNIYIEFTDNNATTKDKDKDVQLEWKRHFCKWDTGPGLLGRKAESLSFLIVFFGSHGDPTFGWSTGHLQSNLASQDQLTANNHCRKKMTTRKMDETNFWFKAFSLAHSNPLVFCGLGGPPTIFICHLQDTWLDIFSGVLSSNTDWYQPERTDI